MTVLNSARKTNNTARRDEQPSEFDGLWINCGVRMGNSDEDSTFVRLPRGIAVSDLKTKKVYDTMDADYAAQVNTMNSLIELIQEAASNLGEGESTPINLEVQLYRKMEEAAPVADKSTNDALKAALFGG